MKWIKYSLIAPIVMSLITGHAFLSASNNIFVAIAGPVAVLTISILAIGGYSIDNEEKLKVWTYSVLSVGGVMAIADLALQISK